MRAARVAAERAAQARHIREQGQDFLNALGWDYRCLSPLAPTIIISKLNATPSNKHRKSPPTATNITLLDAMHQLGLTDLTAGLTDMPPYYPPPGPPAATHPSNIRTCYSVPTTMRVHEAAGRSCQRVFPLWWAPVVPERGGHRSSLAQPRGMLMAGGRGGQQAGSWWKASQMTAYRGVGLVLLYTG